MNKVIAYGFKHIYIKSQRFLFVTFYSIEYFCYRRFFLLLLFFEMAFKIPPSILFVNQENNQTELRRQGKCTSKLSFCRVCSGEARYIHYGSLVCLSCKTFFRRYASYTKV